MKNSKRALLRVRAILKENPLVLAVIICAMLCVYCLVSLRSAAGGAVEESLKLRGSVSLTGEAAEERISLFKTKAEKFIRNRNENVRLLNLVAAAVNSPFYPPAWHGASRLAEAETPSIINVRATAICGDIKIALIEIDGGGLRLVREDEPLGDRLGRIKTISGSCVVWSYGSSDVVLSVEE